MNWYRISKRPEELTPEPEWKREGAPPPVHDRLHTQQQLMASQGDWRFNGKLSREKYLLSQLNGEFDSGGFSKSLLNSTLNAADCTVKSVREQFEPAIKTTSKLYVKCGFEPFYALPQDC